MARSLGKLFARAAIGPINLSVLGIAVLGSVALLSWPIAALGGAAYAALVSADVANPKFRREVLLGRKKPARLPAPQSVADPRLQALITDVAKTRAEVDRIVREMPDRVRRSLERTLVALTELEGHAAQLIERAGELDGFLTTTLLDEARADAAQLRERAAATSDETTRREYGLAADAARDRVSSIEALATSRDRVQANLERIRATVKAVPSKLVRIRTLDNEASDALTGDVGNELDGMNIDLKAFEDTLEALGPAPASKVRPVEKETET
jgi:hypothetical protein